jgi:hypothetical protein
MATFKRLTHSGGEQVDVNMDAIVHIQQHPNHTTIFFAVYDGRQVHTVFVKETPDEIHGKSPLPQAR